MDTKHTPTPWRVVTNKLRYDIRQDVPESEMPPGTNMRMFHIASDMRAVNAAHIVRCVNSHDALLAALSDLVGWIDEFHPEAAKNIQKARAALEEARK